VLALTWDDGPDVGTLELGRFLRRQGVAATFFVVAEWVEGVSADPGEGTGVFATGHRRLPVLAELVRLGHRLGNHTAHHVLLGDASATTVVAELGDAQALLDPFLGGRPRLFRAPGGSWSAAASAAVDADAGTRRLVGPFRWDVDGKDWEASLYCRSDRPAVECEAAAPGGKLRVKPGVVARRYLEAIASAGHGIVLFHDRVGHVGSRYALEVASVVVPALVAQGYAFSAPVLAFGPLSPRAGAPLAAAAAPRAGAPLAAAAAPAGWSAGEELAGATVRFGDLNGDGRLDACGWTPAGVTCALAAGKGFARGTIWMRREDLAAAGVTDGGSLQLGDVDGDGRADLCAQGAAGLLCALAP
jgi:peptidoglycan/xylan/chitin deacetylase (PgdA/CDA1 family)